MQTDFIDVYKEHVWHVYGYLAYRVSGRAEAEDLTQATFERAFRAWNRYDERKASVRTWLLAIARNALIDHGRRRTSRPSVSLDAAGVGEGELPTDPGPEETGLGVSPELARALDRLGRRERSVLALRFGGDMRTAQIAEMLELSVANVQQILSRALRKLRRELEAQGPATESGEPRRLADRRG